VKLTEFCRRNASRESHMSPMNRITKPCTGMADVRVLKIESRQPAIR
jgi:hypothetical protein